MNCNGHKKKMIVRALASVALFSSFAAPAFSQAPVSDSDAAIAAISRGLPPPASVMERTIRRQIATVNSSQQISYPVDSLQTHIEREPEWDRGRMVSILAGTLTGILFALLVAAVIVGAYLDYHKSAP